MIWLEDSSSSGFVAYGGDMEYNDNKPLVSETINADEDDLRRE